MEKYKNLKKGTKVGLILSAVLCFIVLFAQIALLINISNYNDTITFIRFFADISLIIFVLVYSFFLYKKPHDNMLRLTFFIFSMYLAFFAVLDIVSVDNLKSKFYVSVGCTLFSALIIAYIAGRLNKIKKNRILLIAVGFMMLTARIINGFQLNYEIKDTVAIICSITPMFILAALGFAYTARYEEHKAAGLEDK